MAIYIDGITVIADAVVEPVSRTDAKNWMRITDYTSDDTLIDELITSARWFYAAGTYEITYQAGYGDLPADLENDILTLVAWMYENRGKKFQKSDAIKDYPNWDGLNYHQYKKVVI